MHAHNLLYNKTYNLPTGSPGVGRFPNELDYRIRLAKNRCEGKKECEYETVPRSKNDRVGNIDKRSAENLSLRGYGNRVALAGFLLRLLATTESGIDECFDLGCSPAPQAR